LAHKAEHAVDLETGAVTLQDADQGDTTTIIETAIAAAEQIEGAQAAAQAPELLAEIIADKGYHRNQTMIDLAGRRDWIKRTRSPDPGVCQSAAASWSARRRLMRRRGERIERSFAHLYDTGVMRRPR
jgi:transposase